jgi:hypothetical protein
MNEIINKSNQANIVYGAGKFVLRKKKKIFKNDIYNLYVFDHKIK